MSSRRFWYVCLLLVGWASFDTSSPLHAGDHFDQVSLMGDGDFLEDLFPDDWATRTQLAGDLGGLRPAMVDSGVTFNAYSTNYYQGVASGGRDQGFNFGGRGDYFLNVNGEKAGLWKGLFIDLHGETRFGESVNRLSGAILPPNLMLALPLPNNTVTALTGVKVTQALSEEFIVFGGKLNLLDNFRQPLTGADQFSGFMNTSFMFNPVYVRTAPYSTLGAGMAILQEMQPVFTLAVLDTFNTPTVSGFDTFFHNGATLLWQLNLPVTFLNRPGHQGFSGTYSSGKYTDLQPTAYYDPSNGLSLLTTQQTGSWSLAYNFDQALWVDAQNPKRVWGLFGNLGIADNNPSPIRWMASVGFSGASPIASRTLDSFGIGYSYVSPSSVLKETAPLLLPLQNEQAVELYYNIGITPWCHITPDFQIIEPGLRNNNTATLVGVRAKIDF